MWGRATLEELWEKGGGAVLAGGDKVVAKVVVHDGVVECDDALAGELDRLVPWPLPLLPSARGWFWFWCARKDGAALEGVVEGQAALLRAHRGETRRAEEVVVVVKEGVHRRRISAVRCRVGAVHESRKRLFRLHL